MTLDNTTPTNNNTTTNKDGVEKHSFSSPTYQNTSFQFYPTNSSPDVRSQNTALLAPQKTLENKFCFSNEVIKNVASVVEYVDNSVKKVLWTHQEFEDFFARRSAQEIEKNGTTSFLNPCLDQTLVAYHQIKKNYDPTLIIEELFYETYNKHALHFAIAFSDKKDNYYLDFKELNIVVLGKGDYVNINPQVQSQKIHSICQPLPFDKNFDEALPGIVNSFSHFSFEETVEKLQAFNNEHVYKNEFLKKTNNNAKSILNYVLTGTNPLLHKKS